MDDMTEKCCLPVPSVIDICLTAHNDKKKKKLEDLQKWGEVGSTEYFTPGFCALLRTRFLFQLF